MKLTKPKLSNWRKMKILNNRPCFWPVYARRTELWRTLIIAKQSDVIEIVLISNFWWNISVFYWFY